MKYSDLLAEWLAELGYTTCFFVAGGNIMHILESCSHKMRLIPVVHEVAAGIATEYFNEVAEGERAFALVTAGPGVTNIMTAFAGAWLESREMLVIGGQVKTADLSRGKLRQRGIQEIDGVALTKPVSVLATLIEDVITRDAFAELAQAGSSGRKGPVFLELPLDIQGRNVDEAVLNKPLKKAKSAFKDISDNMLIEIAQKIKHAERPVILLGAGVDRQVARQTPFDRMAVPTMTTWNAMDRIDAGAPYAFGRPNTWGQRYANLLLQQADLVVVLGSRLGMQQTGFNWQEFAKCGQVVQVECDQAELDKGHPRVDMPVCGDANQVLKYLGQAELGQHDAWMGYCAEVKKLLPLSESINKAGENYLSPFDFVQTLSAQCGKDDIIVPCSSGGAFTTMMQAFNQKAGQITITNKGLASMGYGLSGAVGAAVAGKGRRTILVEGDGGFSQNIQEIGTAAINKLNLKIFIYDDNGYASIRMTQSNYFGGRYVGCDVSSGLGLPDWQKLFAAWDVPFYRLKSGFEKDKGFLDLFNMSGVVAFTVPIDPKQTYFPKITSRVTESGSMASNPLHKMSPDLDEVLYAQVARYLT